ncbi:cellulase family glycosylhydrolase [Actinomyces sp.]|uniref:cellulase family glycosylhydrolase n=1 Tax=Actinomyces sp. TaxID=29317 RepID=UPI0026DBFACB|nr:cellulase family glycosylhydrolase [Actinomyces sp.]MDO4899695.1 cellulase family glycosylhydrolase [Actinomyces sp.]
MPSRPMPTLSHGTDTRPWLGANFWSREGGPRMWSRYDPSVVRKELKVLHRHGLNLTRSFFYWPDFMPEPDTIDERACANYADFLNAHTELDMRTIPTFLVGHMSGENWDPAWRQGRDIYSDVWMVARQAWYVRQLTQRFHSHPAVAGWLISNEIPIYGGEGEEPVITSWAQLMVDAVRAGGGDQPVSLGDGLWGVETTGHDSGFSSIAYGPLVDFVGPHVYRMEHDRVRQHLKAAFICELGGIANKPVIMEEFGLSSDFVSAQASASYYRQLLHSTLTAGASGWIAWNNTDYDNLCNERPYSHHPFEQHFGITDCEGRPKPPLQELESFSAELAELELGTAHRADTETAIVIPSYLTARYPFTTEVERRLIVDVSEQAYVAAREADLAPGLVHEPEDGRNGAIPGGYKLYLLPSVKQLTAPSWRRLETLADAGTTVYVSYCAGEAGSQRGPWWNRFVQLFGVSPQLTYGLNDPVTDDLVEFTFTTDLGPLHAGTTLTFKASGNAEARAYLPVTVDESLASVIARDTAGRPALVERRHGPGRVLLCTYPIEYFAARLGNVNPEDTWRLYDALAAVADVSRPAHVADPRVMVDTLVLGDGSAADVVISQHDEAVNVLLEYADGRRPRTVELAPLGTRVLRRR